MYFLYKNLNGNFKELVRWLKKNIHSKGSLFSTKKILLISFLKGLASGLGWIIGATILVSLLTYILSQIEFIPILGDIVSQLIKEIEAFDR